MLKFFLLYCLIWTFAGITDFVFIFDDNVFILIKLDFILSGFCKLANSFFDFVAYFE